MTLLHLPEIVDRFCRAARGAWREGRWGKPLVDTYIDKANNAL